MSFEKEEKRGKRTMGKGKLDSWVVGKGEGKCSRRLDPEGRRSSVGTIVEQVPTRVRQV